jgi:hypothetical protein
VQPTGKKVMNAKAFVNGLRGQAFYWVPNPAPSNGADA